MTIRALTVFDADKMAELEKICFSLPWSPESVREELKSPIALYFGAFIEGEIAGYAGVQTVLEEGYITNIAVAPAHRRKGIADTLMRRLISHAEERKLSFLTLEVRESNHAARKLYEKYGFQAVGTRPGYYDQPKEDAVIMTCEYFSD
jgi:ribosomal-protein-alanine N-acetyltransferase